MMMNTEQPNQRTTTTLLPRASGGGGGEADGGGLSAPSSSSPSPSPLTNALLEDLFNPSISTLDLCNLHALSLTELATILESQTFIAAVESFERINAARTSIIEPEAKALAAARLADQLKDKPTTPAHAETQRKAAASFLHTRPGFRPKSHKYKETPSSKVLPLVPCLQQAVKVSANESVVDSQTRKGLQRKNEHMNIKIFAASALATAAMSASAQSFNVDWGSLETSPPASYAGVGLAGVWNTFDEMIPVQQYPLVGLDGQPIPATIMNIGFDVVEFGDIPGTTGGDEALLDDCFTSYNNPIDGCIFMRNLEPGDYRVILYGIAPDDISLLSRLRIDQNTEDPEFVGGTWSGTHENGITYMSQIATVGVDGRLDYHSGLISAQIRSVLNGMQVIQLPPPCAADLNGDGEANFFDITTFVTAFLNEDPIADFNNNTLFNFFDVSLFLSAYAEGC